MKLLLGAGVLAIATVAVWVRLAGDRVMDIVDDDYPPQRDEYLDALFGPGGSVHYHER